MYAYLLMVLNVDDLHAYATFQGLRQIPVYVTDHLKVYPPKP